MNNKGQMGGAMAGPLGLLLTGGLFLGIFVLVVSFLTKINSDVGTSLQVDNGSGVMIDGVATGLTKNGTEAMVTLGENSSTIALIIVVVVIITLLLGGLGFLVFKNA